MKGIIKSVVLLVLLTAVVGCEKKNIPPTCNIINPNDNDTIQIGDTVAIQVEANDQDGNIIEVRLYINEVGVSSSSIFPYNFEWDTKNVILGKHLIKVVAEDNDGSETYDEINLKIIGLPTDANAGEDQTFTDGTVSTTLAANAPEVEYETGKWSIIDGTGGSFDDDTSPTAVFTGQACTSYHLQWTITTTFNSSSDNVNITFNQTPTVADAGADQAFTDETISTMLSANTPEAEHGTGQWSIVSGDGGSFDDATSPTAVFTGQECTSYQLQWTITTSCNSSSDNVNITFNQTPTVADAGTDQSYDDGTTSVTLAGNFPEAGHGTGKWSIVSGDGGSFDDDTSPTAVFNGKEQEMYYLRWTISTNCNNSTDDVIINFYNDGAGNQITDIEGNTYNTVWIGGQNWMAENLKTTKYNDNTSIPNVTDNTEWWNLSTGAYAWYDNNQATFGDTYGALYNWYAVETDNLCPSGWHVPTDEEWKTLTDYLGEEVAGGKLKETGTTHWNSPNTVATNESGFTALPGGSRVKDGDFYGVGDYGHWWSATESSTSSAWSRDLGFTGSRVARDYFSKEFGFSVRCLRD